MEALDRIREALGGRRVDLDAVLREVVDAMTDAVGADRGTLYLVDHARKELVSHVAHLPEISEIRLRIGEGVAGTCAARNTILNVGGGDSRIARKIDEQTGYVTENMLAAPIRGVNGVIGVLQVLNRRTGDFTSGDEDEITRIAVGVAELLDASSLRSQLRPGQIQPLAFRFNGIVGESAAMNVVYDRVGRAARTDATVLVRGETGSGKELVARAIHDNSGRRDAPFVKVDCAALPENLIENELFGHVSGAFTGARGTTTGKVQAAHGGTLFLDEVGELSLGVQGKLLRLVQDRTFLKVGGTDPETVDVRFLFATHRDLEAAVAEGSFRQDLYYRMRVVEVRIPPLRERGHADIDRLVDYFLFEFARRHDVGEKHLTAEARARLHAHPWPGNVRELEHCIESAVVLSSGARIDGGQLTIGPAPAAVSRDPDIFVTGIAPLREVEDAYIQHVLDRCEGNRTRAAEVLGIGRNTLARRLKGSG